MICERCRRRAWGPRETAGAIEAAQHRELGRLLALLELRSDGGYVLIRRSKRDGYRVSTRAAYPHREHVNAGQTLGAALYHALCRWLGVAP